VAGSGEQLPGGICFPTGGDLAAAIATAADDAFGRQEQWVTWGRRNRERYEHLYHIDVLKKNLWTYFHQDVAEKKIA
jgi:hypothetical protein